MERIGAIIERILREDFLNDDNQISHDEVIQDIETIDKEIKNKFENINNIMIENKNGINNIIKYISDLLVEYGEFKRIPEYYKIIDSKAQDYQFFTDYDNREIRGFRVIERNVRRNGKFITEELYILDTGDFYQFYFETINRNNYKECFREQDYDLPNPFDEWDFYKVISKIISILKIRLRQLDEIEDKEIRLNSFLYQWSENLEEIMNID